MKRTFRTERSIFVEIPSNELQKILGIDDPDLLLSDATVNGAYFETAVLVLTFTASSLLHDGQ